ncbi:MAG: lysophospholipid acyltransferase family protein, partial [Planctomycetota bacterium]
VRSPRFMNGGAWYRHQTFETIFPGLDDVLDGRPAVCVTAHIGNWEMVGQSLAVLGVPVDALYRPLDLAPLDAWMREVRARTGMRLVDKFGAMRRLPAIVNGGAIPAIVADQNAGERGEFVPFFGRLTSSYRSVAAVLLRTNATAVVGGSLREPGDRSLGIDAIHDGSFGRRVDELAYRCQMISAIRPEDWADQPDPAFYITARYRRELEQLIRRAPDQYFWMHRVWKSRPKWEREGTGFPPELREKLGALPWMSADDVEAIVEQSDRDAAELARRGSDRLESS